VNLRNLKCWFKSIHCIVFLFLTMLYILASQIDIKQFWTNFLRFFLGSSIHTNASGVRGGAPATETFLRIFSLDLPVIWARWKQYFLSLRCSVSRPNLFKLFCTDHYCHTNLCILDRKIKMREIKLWWTVKRELAEMRETRARDARVRLGRAAVVFGNFIQWNKTD